MNTTRVACAAVFSLLVSRGAVLAGDRFYPGEPLPPSQVALVMVGVHYRLDALTLEGRPKADLLGKDKVELLPGQHHLCVHFERASVSSEGCADLPLVAQAGHAYYIYGSFPPGTGRWEPVFIDFARDEDYTTAKEGKQTRERAQKYFRGDRSPATETVVRAHGQEFHIWR